MLSPETKFGVSLGGPDIVLLDVPAFGHGSWLSLNAKPGGNAGTIRLDVGNASGTVSAELVERTGQARFPEGFYTVTVQSVSTSSREDKLSHDPERRRPLVLRGRPEFDSLEEPDIRRVGKLVVDVAAWKPLGFDLIELGFMGADLVLVPLRRVGIKADWSADSALPLDTTSLWWLTLECGLASVTGVLDALAVRLGGPSAVEALAGRAALDRGCAEVIEQYLGS